MQSLLILGRQPALGLAELESLYGALAVQPVSAHAAIVDLDPSEVFFNRLGGSTRLARLLMTLDTTDWKEIEKYLVKVSPDHADKLDEGKLTIGISAYDLKVSPAAINATGLTLKKVIRKSGRSVRLVPNKEPELNTAQVLHNKLTGDNGWELLLVRDGNKTHLAQTTAVQDIDSYTIRDRERPKRDARVGMLPPKLAQIIINLAVRTASRKAQADVTFTDEPTVLLDPFCGTGVILSEAKLMGFSPYGTDIEPRMIEYSRTNLDWLEQQYDVSPTEDKLEVGDATTHKWQPIPSFVACETYLGRPFTTLPTPEILNQTVSECNVIIKKFLKNIGSQLAPGAKMCIAVPAWQIRRGQFKHLPIVSGDIDQLAELGYNRISFQHTAARDLLYYRPDQIVARELLILVKK
jgi:tRNA G10  N-methylase Trm11